MTEILEWCDPPPPGWGRWQRCARELAGRPGVWARVVEGDTFVYAASSVAKKLRHYGCQVAVRSVGDGKHDVYARWPAKNAVENPALTLASVNGSRTIVA